MRILFCGLSGIPNNTSAPINRYLAIGQAMSLNNEIIFINRIPLYRKNEHQNTTHKNIFRIIDATGIKYRPDSFFKRNYLKLVSFILEFFVIKKLNSEKKIDFVNVYTQFFGIYVFYYLLSKLFNFKIILHYVEFRSEITDGRSLFYRLNSWFFDKNAAYFCDKIITISNFLNNHILEQKPTANTLIIPPICDFKYFNSIKPEKSDKRYFVFCASASYEDVILFVIESFLDTDNSQNTDLHLVINGKLSDQKVLQLIDLNKDQFKLYSGLKYETLIAKYKGSLAQLIPLRNSAQDCARFPQKICEYLASKRPIITTNFGEIPHYFTDKQNAIIASEYDINSYSLKLEWTMKNEDKLSSLSENSYTTGINSFDIDCYNDKIENFLRS